MRIEIFVDAEPEPRPSFEAPGTFELDTTGLADGPHMLRIEAREGSDPPGIEHVPFTVRNGPGIAVFGLREGETIRGRIPVLVNAYGSRVGDEFDPVRAETPAPTPTWAWALFYIAAEYRDQVTRVARPEAAAPSSQPNGTASVAGAPDGKRTGEKVFSNQCAACHQADGKGVPGVFPPLRDSGVVLAADATEQIHVILFGLSGKTIGGVDYAAAMPGFADLLDDDEIADVARVRSTGAER